LPEWVKQQRHSWHGVDYMYHGELEFDRFYRRYCETLLGIDESVGRMMAHLDQTGLAESTVLIYTSDNGFSFGERGLIDKRHAYEESIKVPFVLRWPEAVDGGTVIPQMIQNIDIAPTLLELAGLGPPSTWSDARSCHFCGARRRLGATESSTITTGSTTSR
jgi:arylsulfatase A-like enzyme